MKSNIIMTQQEIDNFEKLQAQLEGLHQEISILSKKSQHDTINKFKLKFVNQVLAEANNLLGEKYKPFPNFDVFDENEMPTNSDVAMILTQYEACFEKLRCDHVIVHMGEWVWLVDEKPSEIKSRNPIGFVR